MTYELDVIRQYRILMDNEESRTPLQEHRMNRIGCASVGGAEHDGHDHTSIKVSHARCGVLVGYSHPQA